MEIEFSPWEKAPVPTAAVVKKWFGGQSIQHLPNLPIQHSYPGHFKK
jgi:hypothetical protein